MPSKKHYDLVSNDDFDSRIPLHTEEAFQHGITFQAKFIGGLDIPRPTTRLEIVSAMRRARYEFKARGIKKKKVILEVSVDGLKISMRRKKKKKEPSDSEESKLLLMHHPIYRIFYVSHDSQDLKIFSYIARDTSSNMFRCNVFKTNKKTQAMRIVRTVGQAFEVCHKLNTPTSADDATTDEKEGGTESGSEEQGSDTHSVTDKPKKDYADMNGSDKIYDSSPLTVTQSQLSILADPPPPQPVENYPRPVKLDLFSSPEAKRTSTGDVCIPASTPLALQHEVQLLREQLEQQQQQTHAALAQVHLLRDQLAAETAARMEAQARTHQLLVHNRELLDHIQTLVLQMQELETKLGPSPNCQISVSQLPNPAFTNGKLPILSEMDLPAPDVHLIENPRARDSSTCESIALGLQQQLQQQQQQYALMLAQVGQQMNFLPPLALYNNFGGFAAAAASSPYNLSYSALSPPPPHTPRLNPLGQFANLGSYGNPMTSPAPPGLGNNNNSNNINNANLANFYSSAQSSPPSQSMNTNFILPLAELEASNASTYPLNLPPIVNNRSADHMRQLQDAVNPTASVNSLSSDSDRQRFDSKNSSSLESMSPTVSQRAGLPSLHQQLEHMRMGGAGCSTTDAEDRDRLSTLRRNGPFITRSTSEKVPHRNEILAQTQPAAKVEEWLRRQSIMRPESGYAEESAELHQNQLRDLQLQYNNSATESPVLEPKKKPKWKFLSRKSSWRSF